MLFAGTAAWLKSADWKRPATYAILVGVLGLTVLTFLIVGGLCHALYRPSTPSCQSSKWGAVDPKSGSDGIQITGISPSDIERDHQLCIRVENVVPEVMSSTIIANAKATATAAAQKADLSKATAQALVAVPNTQAQATAISADADATKAKADAASAQIALNDLKKPRSIVLYLNGKASPLTAPAQPISGEQALTFDISAPEDANDTNAAFWRGLLSQPINAGKISLRVGVAEQGQPAPAVDWDSAKVDGKTKTFTYLVYTPVTMWLAGGSLLAIFIGFVGIACSTSLLRTGLDPKASYSLSLTQMALWLFLTTTGFVYIWLVTGQYIDVFTPALFVLIGISGATAGVAQAIDFSGDDIPRSRNFINDIAGNWKGGQVQLQRLQILVWTLILGAIFCWNVIFKLVLTPFDANLLILAGIANGVYVSLKPQEMKKAPAVQS